MNNSRTYIILLGLALLACLAAGKQDEGGKQAGSLAAKLLPSQYKVRHSRSLGDMFEKMRSKIFGSRKVTSSPGQGSSAAPTSQLQTSASANSAQRQPWGDLNSFNQQFNPYSPLSSSYPYSSNSQYLSQQYNPMTGSFMSSAPQSAYAGLSASPSGASSLLSSIDGQMQQSQQQGASALGPQGAISSASQAVAGQSGTGGLLSSASHLIAQYLSPAAQSGIGSAAASSQQQATGQQQNGQSSLMSPQQQQQQSQYNEFASILDSMVAQTGMGSQRQPSLSQYLNPSAHNQGQQAGSSQQNQYANQMGVGQQQFGGAQMNGANMMGDQDMSGSSNIQSYMPAASAPNAASSSASSLVGQQASQKSSMVGLAEQLAPGAQFNKLVSFPFSLSNNEDPSKEGRYKLHIPFLNQHVKRSDQQQAAIPVSSASNQQQQQQSQQQPQQQRSLSQQYLNSYVNQQQQQQQYANQQMMAQASQVIPSIVNPQSSPQQQSQAQQQQVASAVAASPISQPAVSAQSPPLSSVQTNQIAPASSSSVSSSVSSSSASQVSSNARPTWSVADLQSSASSSKLIPMQVSSAVGSSAVDSSQSDN